MKDHTLLVITDSYPYGTGEMWIDDESVYYSTFQNVYIAPMGYTQKLRRIRDGITVIDSGNRMMSNRFIKGIICLRYLFTNDFFEEFRILYKSKRLSVKTLKRAISFIAKGKKQSKCIYNSIVKQGLNVDSNIIIYSYWMAEAGYTATQLALLFPRSRCITRCHGYDLYEEDSIGEYIPKRNYILTRMDRIFCISQNGKQYLLTKYGDWLEKKITVSHLGSEEYGMEEYRREQSVFRILSIGSFIWEKRIELIVDGIKLMNEAKKNTIIWEHFGIGPLMEEIIEKTKSLPETVKCIFHGFVSHDEMMEYIKKSYFDCFINTSKYEGIPVSIMEAISLGIPVVATNIGGNPEIVIHQKNGFIIPEESTGKEVCDALKTIGDMNEQDYLNLRRNARKSWERDWSSKNNYGDFIREISNL